LDKVAVISDVHGNMPALEAVLADIRQRGIEPIYNLGDLIGKGPDSDHALDVCRDVCQVVLRGNWDEGILLPQEKPALIWYQEQLGPERLAYLAGLPNAFDFWMSGKRIRLFHASQTGVYDRVYPWQPREVHEAMFTNTAFTGMTGPEPDIVGYGDIHTTYMHTLPGRGKLLFNAGSVGNPLDFPLASYVILSGRLGSEADDAFSIEFVRLPYDIEATLARAKQLNAPDFDVYSVELRTAVYRNRQKQTQAHP
jgi:protein phosphatase